MTQRARPSPAVYRRRRLVAAVLAVFVLALVVWGARGLTDYFTGQDEAAPTADSQNQAQEHDDAAANPESESAPSTAEDTAEQQEVDGETDQQEAEQPEGSCSPGDVQVRASTHQESYGSDVAPLLIMDIENTGGDDCILDVGTAEQVFTVSHSGREVFNSAQCGSDEESLEMEFEPGQTERAQLTWPRSDSSADCTEPTELVTGDYDLTVSVSGITSEPHSFHISGVEQ